MIRGAPEFLLTVAPEHRPLVPPLRHNGRRTLWKMVGTEELAQQVEAAICEAGCRVERYTEEQTPEQEAERLQGE